MTALVVHSEGFGLLLLNWTCASFTASFTCGGDGFSLRDYDCSFAESGCEIMSDVGISVKVKTNFLSMTFSFFEEGSRNLQNVRFRNQNFSFLNSVKSSTWPLSSYSSWLALPLPFNRISHKFPKVQATTFQNSPNFQPYQMPNFRE